MRHIILLVGVLSAFAVRAEASGFAPDEISSYLIVMKNPDYGALTDIDVHQAQVCKDDLLFRVDAKRENRDSARAISRAEPAAREMVAAAINVCLRDRAEGVHVLPSDVRLKGPLLH